MNAPAAIDKPTPPSTKLDLFRMQVLPPDKWQDLKRGLPAHIKPERFERNFVNALMQWPWLMDHPPQFVYREIAKAAALGLLLDPQLGECYLIESYDGKLKKKVPQLRVGYRGLIKLARQSGEVSMVYAHAVHANDEIECLLGDQKRLHHKPDMFGDRGPVVGYYAVVKYKDGDTDFEPMNKAEIDAIRDRSDAYKAFKNGLIKSTPWTTDYDEMAKKTAIRRLSKRAPLSPELADAVRLEETADRLRDVTPRPVPVARGPEPVALPSKLDALEGSVGSDDGDFTEGGHDDDGVVTDDATTDATDWTFRNASGKPTLCDDHVAFALQFEKSLGILKGDAVGALVGANIAALDALKAIDPPRAAKLDAMLADKGWPAGEAAA